MKTSHWKIHLILVEVLWKLEHHLNEILSQTLPWFISVNNSEQNLLGVWLIIPKGHGPVS